MRDQPKDTPYQEGTQDLPIRIEGIEPDLLRGYVQVPNYFLYYWVPIIGHKAAMTYEMILSFAHGNKDTCHPSLSRLCAHLGMTRKELTGRKRRIGKGRKIKEYHEKGTLEILQDHGLLSIEVHGNSLHAQSYTFKILKRPPFLLPEQLFRLPKSLQESHQRLMEKSKANDSKSRNSQAPKEGMDDVHGRILPMAIKIREKDETNHSNPHNYQASKVGRDNVTTPPVTMSPVEGMKGGDIVTPNKTTTMNRTTTTEPTPPTPQRGAVVVVSVPIPQQNLTPPISAPSGLSPTDAPAGGSASLQETASGKGKTPSSQAPPTPPLSIVLPPGSLFAPYREQLEGLAARHGVGKVADYVDKLDWQYRQKKEPPGKPIALLNKLLREGMITPEGYQTPQEREALRLEEARVSQAVWAAEARRRAVAETLRQKDAQDQALWETLPEEERALWVRQVAPEVPEVCRSEFLLGMLARAAFLEQRGLHGDPAGEGLTAPRPSDGHPSHNGRANPGSALALS